MIGLGSYDGRDVGEGRRACGQSGSDGDTITKYFVLIVGRAKTGSIPGELREPGGAIVESGESGDLGHPNGESTGTTVTPESGDSQVVGVSNKCRQIESTLETTEIIVAFDQGHRGAISGCDSTIEDFDGGVVTGSTERDVENSITGGGEGIPLVDGTTVGATEWRGRWISQCKGSVESGGDTQIDG